jgi:hypothetical protein
MSERRARLSSRNRSRRRRSSREDSLSFARVESGERKRNRRDVEVSRVWMCCARVVRTL